MKPTIGSKSKSQAKLHRSRSARAGFNPDTRGVGGKQLVVEILALHQYRLNQIKSTIKTTPPPPKIKGQGQYSTNAFKVGFSGPPSTYHLAPKLSAARRVHVDRSDAEHQNRRDHMARRMHDYPNRKDREQNPMDPVAHPVLLIRSDDGGPKRVFYANPYDATDIRPVAAGGLPGSPSHGMSRSASSTSPFGGKRPGTALDGSPHSRSSAALRPNTAPNKDGFMFSRANAASVPNLHGTGGSGMGGGRGRSPSPGKSGAGAGMAYGDEQKGNAGGSGSGNGGGASGGDPYVRLKQKLLSLIVEHRIYREANLRQLFDKALAINSHLDPVRLQRVVDSLRAELEVDLDANTSAASAALADGAPPAAAGRVDSKHAPAPVASSSASSASGPTSPGAGSDGPTTSAAATAPAPAPAPSATATTTTAPASVPSSSTSAAAPAAAAPSTTATAPAASAPTPAPAADAAAPASPAVAL